jgi:hypothetical protein
MEADGEVKDPFPPGAPPLGEEEETDGALTPVEDAGGHGPGGG